MIVALNEGRLQSCLYQQEMDRRREPRGWQGARPGSAVGNTAFGDRVGEQELGRITGKALAVVHTFEETRHGIRVHTGSDQGLHAHPVRFPFVLAGVGQLRLDGTGLSGGDTGHAGFTITGNGDCQAGQHGGQHGGVHLFRVQITAGKMPLADVGNFVGHHAAHFVFVAGIEEQPGVKPDHAAGYRKGVNLTAVDDHDVQIGFFQVTVGGEPVDQAFHIFLHQRVGHDRGLPAQAAQPAATQPVLLVGGHQCGGGITQNRQVVIGAGGCQRAATQQQDGA